MCIQIHEQTQNVRGCPDRKEVVGYICGTCWQCRRERVNDFVGRMLCEAHDSQAVCAITLTYRDEPDRKVDLAHEYITPRHFQNYIKLLRAHGYKLKYFVAGEYGKLRARAHFHAILFFQPTPRQPFPPKWEQEKIIEIPEFWPHGHVWVDWTHSERSLRYVCKYLLKDSLRNKETSGALKAHHQVLSNWCSMSKKPPLGWAYYVRLAERQIDHRLPPNSFVYAPPGSDEGKKRKFHMRGATRRDYCLMVYDRWLESIGEFPWKQIPEAVARVFRSALLWRAEREATYDAWGDFADKFSNEIYRKSVPWEKQDEKPREFCPEESMREAEARCLTVRILRGTNDDKTTPQDRPQENHPQSSVWLRSSRSSGPTQGAKTPVSGYNRGNGASSPPSAKTGQVNGQEKEGSFEEAEPCGALSLYCRNRRKASPKERASIPCCGGGAGIPRFCEGEAAASQAATRSDKSSSPKVGTDNAGTSRPDDATAKENCR